MELKIVVNSGEEAGSSRTVTPGQTLRVGRTQPAELRLPDDAMLSTVHFSLELQTDVCRITDLDSKFGTQVNGVKIQTAELAHGDIIRAGNTSFGIQIVGSIRPPQQSSPSPAPMPVAEATPPPIVPPADPEPAPAVSLDRLQVLAYLQALASTTSLFAILDAAREPSILQRLHQHDEQCQSLYEGEKGESLAPFGPWLVRLPATSKLLAELVKDGWGKSWGVFLTSSLSFADVRKHFRQFLRVQLPDGRFVYFRYYDPRVLRTYLASSTQHDLRDFYGTMQRYVMEAAEGDGILEYLPHAKGARKIVVS